MNCAAGKKTIDIKGFFKDRLATFHFHKIDAECRWSTMNEKWGIVDKYVEISIVSTEGPPKADK
jgi:hypothetical protein